MKRQDLLGSTQERTGEYSSNFRMDMLLKESEHVRNSERLIGNVTHVQLT